MTKDIEMAVVFFAFTTLAVTGKTCFQECQSHSWKAGSNKGSPSMEEDQIGEHLHKLDIHKSIGCDGMHSWVVRELADMTERLW